jgi:hypothetical protein
VLSSLLVAVALASAPRHLSPNLAATRRFEANLGQWPSQVRFVARTPHGLLALGNADASLTLRGASGVTVRLMWNRNARQVTGIDPLPGVSHYLVGDRSRWRRGVRGFERVRYHDVAPSVDLDFYGAMDGFEYDLIVRPGGNPNALALRVDGVSAARIDADGSMVLDTPAGAFRQHRPIAFQEHRGVRTAVDVRYELRDGRIGFRTGAYDRSRALVIDPTFDFSTYLGGSGGDTAQAVTTDAAGYVYVAGDTYSSDFPTAAALFGVPPGGTDGFVAKFTPDGASLVYATYLGGFGSDLPSGLAVAADGSAYVAGTTGSPDFPMVAAFQSTKVGDEGFVARLAPDGASLVFSTYLGGSGQDSINGVALDASGAAYVTGGTSSQNFPVKNAFKTFGVTFIAKFTSAGSLVYSTYFSDTEPHPGGSLNAIAVDASGAAYVGGATGGQIPATAGAFQTSRGDGTCVTSTNFPIPCLDGVVAKLTPSGGLAYATYLHATTSEILAGPTGDDAVTGITVDATGNAYVVGWTTSPAFPTTPGAAAQGCMATGCAPYRVFVTELNPPGSGLVFSATLGGTLSGLALSGHGAIVLDALGQVVVAGRASGMSDLPLVNPLQPQPGSSSLFKLTNNGLDIAPLVPHPGLGADTLASGPGGLLYLRSSATNFPVAAVSKSTDDGATWTIVANSVSGFGLSVDPNNASILYTNSQKSTDGGASWVAFPAKGSVPVVRPGASNVLFALRNSTDPPGAVMRSVDGGATWTSSSTGITDASVQGVAISPSSPDVMYAWRTNTNRFTVFPATFYVSTDGGSSWTPRSGPAVSIASLVVNPSQPLTVYVVAGSVLKSTDGAMTWTGTFGSSTIGANSLVAPTATTAYIAATDGIYRSADTGDTWTRVQTIRFANGPLTATPDAVFALANNQGDTFIATLTPTGAVVYESYLGGIDGESPTGLARAPDGAVVVTGFTSSLNFPTANAFQPAHAGGSVDAFITKFRIPQVLCAIGVPVDHATAYMPFEIGGWALDFGSATDSGIDGVHVWAFSSTGVPTFIGAVTPSVARPDVAALFGPQFATAGFSITVGGLVPGTYTLAIYPHSQITNTFAPPQVLTVTVANGGLIAIGAPTDGAIAYGGTLLGGWAIDRASTTGTGVSVVHVYAYPNPGSGEAPVFLGVADYGIARPDVGAIFGSRFTNSGFNLYLPPLTPGPYLLVAFPFSTMTNAFLAPATVTVTIGPSRPNGALNPPADNAIVSGGFLVGGWAIDQAAPSGPGVDAVHVYAFPAAGGEPTFLGVAQYGISRPDVGAIFGSQFTASGYMLDAPALPAGTYDIYAFSRSTVSGTFNFARVARITAQ